MPECVVSNTTPLLSLLKIGQLDLLRQLYGQIHIPQAVWLEIESGRTKPFYIDLSAISWISIDSLRNPVVLEYLTGLDADEAETIVLARELQADRVIIDEQLGRRYAKYYGLTVTGTLGILLKAKQERLVKTVQPHITQLLQQGIWLDKRLIELILQKAGEL